MYQLGDKLAGYEIDGIGRADHRGAPAFRFDLVNEDGQSVGRVVLTAPVAQAAEPEQDWNYMWLVANDLPIVAKDTKIQMLDSSNVWRTPELVAVDGDVKNPDIIVQYDPGDHQFFGVQDMLIVRTLEKVDVAYSEPQTPKSEPPSPGYYKTKKVIASDLKASKGREVYHKGSWHKFGPVVHDPSPAGFVLIHAADDDLCEEEPIIVVAKEDVLPVRTKSA